MHYINTKRVIILINGASRWYHTNNLFYNYPILKYNDIVELKPILLMCDAYHNVLPNDLQQLFVKYISSYSTRRTPQLLDNMSAYESNIRNCTLCEIVELTKYIAC